jgi:hypothetical protein
MPHKTWTHFCDVSQAIVQTGSEVCRSCGNRGEYTGWGYSMHEAMWAYQQQTGLKPVGPHRPLADRLFSSRLVACEACHGKGLHDVNHGEGWELCPRCKGAGYLFDGTAEEFKAIRQEVLSRFPDADVSG